MTTTETSVQRKVAELVERQLAEGRQTGTQVCAYQHGERIVDIAAGKAGPEPGAADVRPDTLFSSFSTTKGPAALAVHILADRGQLDYDAPVAQYWPEFGAHGKDRVTVAQAMSHQSGLHEVPKPYTAETLADWDYCMDDLANRAPAYEPGTDTGYHAITYSWIAGGIVEKAGGRHIKQVLADDIAGPLGVGDEMYIGIPDGVEDRLTTLIAAPPPEPGQQNPAFAGITMDHDFFKAMPPNPPFTFNDMIIRKACLPAANGHFSARALARMYGALANGGEIDGVRIVSKERIPHMQRLMVDKPDRVIMMPIRKGIGFFLGGERGGMPNVQGPRETAFGHSGAGGSTAFADPEVGLSVAVTLNQMQPAMQGEGVAMEISSLIRTELGVN